MSCIHIGGALSPEELELAKKQKFRYTSPRKTKRKINRLIAMAMSWDYRKRESAAGNPMTPKFILHGLAHDPTVSVRAWVARNPKVTPKLLNLLVTDEVRMIAVYAWNKLQQLEDELNNEEHQYGNGGKFPGEVDVDLED